MEYKEITDTWTKYAERAAQFNIPQGPLNAETGQQIANQATSLSTEAQSTSQETITQFQQGGGAQMGQGFTGSTDGGWFSGEFVNFGG
jgi:hypothetical protein